MKNRKGLTKRIIVNKNGHKQTVWVRSDSRKSTPKRKMRKPKFKYHMSETITDEYLNGKVSKSEALKTLKEYRDFVKDQNVKNDYQLAISFIRKYASQNGAPNQSPKMKLAVTSRILHQYQTKLRTANQAIKELVSYRETKNGQKNKGEFDAVIAFIRKMSK